MAYRHPSRSGRLLLSLLVAPLSAAMAEPLIIDDRSRDDLVSALGTTWRMVADTVMGGVSSGRLQPAVMEGRPCLRLTGRVSLDNDGGFLQMSLDLSPAGELDASAWSGVELTVRGNGETYNVHLRNRDTRIVWQSYRATFRADPQWRLIRLPFAEFRPYRIDRPLVLHHLRRLGLVAIGREMEVDLCVARVAFY